MKPLRLSRRHVLRGGAVALALPMLEVMQDKRARAATIPRYLLTMMLPNGVAGEHWYPATEGANWKMEPKMGFGSNWLEPLMPYQNDFSLVTGLSKFEAWDNQDLAPGDVHVRSAGTFATGAAITRNGAGGPSVDQIIAKRLSLKTLATALGKLDSPHKSHMSWTAADVPVVAERDPIKLWERLFQGASTSGPVPADASSSCKGVLDFVRADLGRLKTRLGAADRIRVEAHESFVRELETEVCNAKVPKPGTCSSPQRPGDTSALTNERAQLMLRLQVLAFSCDLAQVGSFALGAGGNYERVFDWLGAKDNHHSISHRDFRSDKEGASLQEKHLQDQVKQVAFLINLLKTTPSGQGTLFDDSLLFVANEHGAGWDDTHSMGDMPILFAGGAAGRLVRGRHFRFPGGKKEAGYASALVTILHAFGIADTKVGTYGLTPLPGVLS